MLRKKILLIGGAGFIGRNLVKYVYENLVKDEMELFVLSRSYENNRYIRDDIQYILGSYTDLPFLNTLFEKEKFTHVFHFASTTIPVSSNQNIVGDVHDNLVATINLLEVMKRNNCNFILYLSSGGAVYGEFKHDMLDENHPCEPISSYGVIKLTIEQYIRLYHRQEGIDYLILRISNPYGPFHVSEKQGVINIAIRKAFKDLPLEVWGTGEQSKDYIYVEDIIKIIWLLIVSRIKNEIINVGSGETLSLNSILGRIKSIMPDFKISYQSSKPSDVARFCLDVSKLNSLINVTLTPIDKGLEKTLNWEKGNKND